MLNKLPFHIPPYRVALISMHTSPLAQAGQDDAGGMNVYIINTAKELACKGVHVEIFTRSVSSQESLTCEIADKVLVRNIPAGPQKKIPKSELPTLVDEFIAGVLTVSSSLPSHYYDLIHSHYWLSGHIGQIAKEYWSVPLVHTAHTLAAIKNRYLAPSDTPEPECRIIGEKQIIAEANRLIVNTSQERTELISEYNAYPDRIDIVTPGVDTQIFSPGPYDTIKAELDLDQGAFVIGFIGRIQPLKGIDILLQAVKLITDQISTIKSSYSSIKLVIVGGISGDSYNERTIMNLISELRLQEYVHFLSPMPQEKLAMVYRACNVVTMPSYSESFGLVALEAQACATPVIATRVGGLSIALNDGISGILLADHDPEKWANKLIQLISTPENLANLSQGALRHSKKFSWSQTADLLLESYAKAAAEYQLNTHNLCDKI